MKWLLFAAVLLMCNLTPTQQVNYEQKQAYFKKLLNLQQILQQKVENLQHINQHTIDTIDSLKSHPDLQKITLHQGIKNQRSLIEQALSQTLIPLKQNTWTCKNLSPSEKDLIAQKIKDLKDKNSNINNLLQSENNCQRNVELKSQSKLLKLHIDSLQNQLSNTCQPPRKNDKQINYLGTTNNWVYGSLSPNDYQQKLNNLQKQNNLIECDKSVPFIINNQCSACSKPQEIFSISQEKCIDKCPTGKIFLKANHQCRDPNQKQFLPHDINSLDASKNPYIWGPITEQQYKDKVDQLKSNKIPTEQCPADKPFPSNGETCTTCSSGQIFNIGTKTCTNCNDQQKYLSNSHQCKQIFKKPNYDAGKNWIAQNGDNKPIDKKLKQLQSQGFPVQQCPSDKPFPSKDLKSCVACQKKYNLITGTCDQCNKFFAVKQGDHQCTYVTKDCQKDTFWNGQKCIKCLTPGHYDNNWRQCACDKPLKIDQESGECLPADKTHKNSNPDKAKNYIGTAPKPSKFLDNCLDSTPFYDEASKACISCSLPSKYFNYDTKKCEECEKNLVFSIADKKCVQPVKQLNSIVGPNVNNYCCGEPSVDKSKDTCPNDTPFFDGYHCVSCSKPQYFDFKDKQCKSCPSGKSFNTATKSCVDSKLLQPKFVSNVPSSTSNYIGKIPDEKPDTQGQQVTKCPTDKPFSNGKDCLSCDLPRYFNFQSSQCQICKEGYSFSTSQKQCQKNTFIGAEFFNSNMVAAENFIGKVPAYKSQYSQCPSEKRYFNGQQCESCDLPKYWNFQKNECKSCENGLYFDKYSRQCLYSAEGQKFKTNLDAQKKIYYNGDFEDVKNQVASLGDKSVCPSDKPFYDKSSNSCINCEGDSNVFNYLKNHCMRCPDGTHFNQQYHICFQNGVEPSVERMVMNSVSWI